MRAERRKLLCVEEREGGKKKIIVCGSEGGKRKRSTRPKTLHLEWLSFWLSTTGPGPHELVTVTPGVKYYHVLIGWYVPGHILIGWSFTRLGSSQDQSDCPPRERRVSRLAENKNTQIWLAELKWIGRMDGWTDGWTLLWGFLDLPLHTTLVTSNYEYRGLKFKNVLFFVLLLQFYHC